MHLSGDCGLTDVFQAVMCSSEGTPRVNERRFFENVGWGLTCWLAYADRGLETVHFRQETALGFKSQEGQKWWVGTEHGIMLPCPAFPKTVPVHILPTGVKILIGI